MRIPGVPSLIFLGYLFLFLPWAAFRSARRLSEAKETTGAKPLPSRKAIWGGTLLLQGFLLLLSSQTGRSFGYRLFEVPTLGTREVVAALVALGGFFILRAISLSLRSESERRQMVVYRLAPRRWWEWTLWSATVLMASVAEEAAYRGVGLSILWYSLDNLWAAVLLCSTVFALAHWTQGWKSAAIIFGMALIMHGLVQFTGTLVLAMIVHATYDFVAGYLIGREALRFDEEAATAGSL
jgi:membrane protease YdiL (CAAX protease family)